MPDIKQDKPFKIHGIELISFSLQPQPAREYPKEIFEFNIQQEPKTNAEKRLIIIFTTVIIKESGQEAVLANLKVACGFEMLFFESTIKRNKEGDYIIPHELNSTITRIAIATTRGVLYSQLRGSYLQNTALPVLPIE
jgi:hypothetical protein